MFVGWWLNVCWAVAAAVMMSLNMGLLVNTKTQAVNQNPKTIYISNYNESDRLSGCARRKHKP